MTRPRWFVELTVLALLLAACSAGEAPRTQPTPTPTSTPRETPTPTPDPAPSEMPHFEPPQARHQAAPKPAPPKPKPPIVVPGTADVFVLCDSVLLGAKTELREALAPRSVTIDCLGSRRLPQGITVLKQRREEIGDVAVIHLGNNYIAGEGDFGDQIDQAMKVLSGTKLVVWVTVAERWPSRATINNEIRQAAARWPTIRVADWAVMIEAHPGYAYDMLHLTPSGRAAIAKLIAKTIGPAA